MNQNGGCAGTITFEVDVTVDVSGTGCDKGGWDDNETINTYFKLTEAANFVKTLVLGSDTFTQ